MGTMKAIFLSLNLTPENNAIAATGEKFQILYSLNNILNEAATTINAEIIINEELNFVFIDAKIMKEIFYRIIFVLVNDNNWYL